MSSIFGVEHHHHSVPLPHGGVQHCFHLPNGVKVSAVQAASIGASGTPEVSKAWEVYAWREDTPGDVYLAGSDQDGIIDGLTTDQVGERIREAAALPKVGA